MAVKSMAIPRWSFKGRDTNIERFLAKNQLQSNEIGVMSSCQKLGIILENKVIYKFMLSKHFSNKKILTIFCTF